MRFQSAFAMGSNAPVLLVQTCLFQGDCYARESSILVQINHVREGVKVLGENLGVKH